MYLLDKLILKIIRCAKGFSMKLLKIISSMGMITVTTVIFDKRIV